MTDTFYTRHKALIDYLRKHKTPYIVSGKDTIQIKGKITDFSNLDEEKSPGNRLRPYWLKYHGIRS